MKYGINNDGRRIGPIDPSKVRDTGWTWFNTASERDNAPPQTLEQAIANRIAEIEARHAEILSGGFDYDFGTKTATLPDGTTEPAGIRTIQTRPADRERWAATNQVASQYIANGQPGEPMRPFRTADNARVPMTASEANACLNAMQAKFGAALEAMWDHKDAVRSPTTVADVQSYDHTTGWPT